MEFKIDSKSFKLKRMFRIIFFILVSLCLISLSIASFFMLIDVVLVPIVVTVLIVLLLVLLGLLFFVYMEKDKDTVFILGDDTLKTKDYSVNFLDIYRLIVYTRKGINYKIKIKTIFDSYTIDKLESNGIDEIIGKIMEVKNGKDI